MEKKFHTFQSNLNNLIDYMELIRAFKESTIDFTAKESTKGIKFPSIIITLNLGVDIEKFSSKEELFFSEEIVNI